MWNILNEIFKEIKGYEGRYSISNNGRIYSHAKSGTGGHFGKFLNGRFDKDGYVLVNLYKDGKRKTFKIHRLVGEYFINNPNKYEQINHIDNNRSNNKFDNLEWCDSKINSRHCWDQKRGYNPLHKPGYEHSNRKLLKEDYEQIKKLRLSGVKLRILSEKFGLSVSQICYISKGKQL